GGGRAAGAGREVPEAPQGRRVVVGGDAEGVARGLQSRWADRLSRDSLVHADSAQPAPDARGGRRVQRGSGALMLRGDFMASGYNGMGVVKVRKDVLLDTVRANREKHRNIFLDAVKGFREKAIAV